jgi:hypothetical protein
MRAQVVSRHCFRAGVSMAYEQVYWVFLVAAAVLWSFTLATAI